MILPLPERHDTTRYNPFVVKQLLDRFLSVELGLSLNYSRKRKGYIVDCPNGAQHSHYARNDDCVIVTTEKDNGFIYLGFRCRHTSCWEGNKTFAQEINREWGKAGRRNKLSKFG